MVQSDPSNIQHKPISPMVIILLGLVSMFLCLTGVFFFLTPLPLAMGMILTGRVKGIYLLAGCLALLSLFAMQAFPFPFDSLIIAAYLVSCLIASGVSEIIFQRIHPVRGFFFASFGIFALVAVFFTAFSLSVKGNMNEHMLKMVEVMTPFLREMFQKQIDAGAGESIVIGLQLLKEPQEFLNQYIVPQIPLAVFKVTFIGMWAILLIVLNYHPLLVLRYSYPYRTQDLLNFRLPFWVVYPLIGTLAYTLLASDSLGEVHQIIGWNLLYGFGVFYFFQGFGIVLDFFAHIKITGFLRTLLLVMIVVLAAYVVAIVGLFDTWADFRQKFTKSMNEGE